MVFAGHISDQKKLQQIGYFYPLSNDPNINKIPVYASQYRKEYLFIRGINKEIKYLYDNINEATNGLFKSNKCKRVVKFIKRFLLTQERGRLKDTSNFEIKSEDVKYIIKLKNKFDDFNNYIGFCKCCYNEDDITFIDPYPGMVSICDVFELFFSKFKIKYEYSNSFWDYVSDYDSDEDEVFSDYDDEVLNEILESSDSE